MKIMITIIVVIASIVLSTYYELGSPNSLHKNAVAKLKLPIQMYITRKEQS